MRLSFRRITTTTTQVRVQQRGGIGGTDTDTEGRTRMSTAREGGAITRQDIGTGTSARTAREGATTPRGVHRKLSRGGKRALSIVVPSLDMMTGRENTATTKDEVGEAEKVATVASAGTAEKEEEGKEEVEVNHLVDYVVVAGPPVGIAGDVIGRCNVRKLLMEALQKEKRHRRTHPASPPSSSSSSSSSSTSASASSSTSSSNGTSHTGGGHDRRLCATVNLPGCNPTLLQRYPDTDRKSLALVRLFVTINLFF